MYKLQLEEFKKSKEALLNGPYKELTQKVKNLPHYSAKVTLGDSVQVDGSPDNLEEIISLAKELKPWRKGPFTLFDTFIDTEWQSNLKYDIIKDSFNLEGKSVADIGCNNAYYLFRMLEQNPAKLVGFDPSPITYLQFEFINKFINSEIQYELLGVEHLLEYKEKFDVIFCLGVLYHRKDPITMLKYLKQSLNSGGEVILDTIIINGEDEICLTPRDRYAKMRNVFFLPTLSALKNWLFRAGFKEVEHIANKQTDIEEQRKTEWIHGESLETFLDENDPSKTVEGYPAPIRCYVKAKI